MNSTEVALLALTAFGVIFGAFSLWLVYPRGRNGARPAKSDIKPAE